MGTEKPAAVPNCPQQMPHRLAWDQIQKQNVIIGAISNIAFNSSTTTKSALPALTNTDIHQSHKLLHLFTPSNTFGCLSMIKDM
jgi:hypothetical protein